LPKLLFIPGWVIPIPSARATDIIKVLNFAEGYDLNRLETDRRARAAMLCEIVVIGEAANKIQSNLWEELANELNIANR
jgi:uncharacterized protein with HEPN domain